MDKNNAQESAKLTSVSTRNNMLIYVVGGIVVLAGLIFLIKSSIFDSREINAKILKNDIYVDEPLSFSDNTRDAKAWVWEFGNGEQSNQQTGNYTYPKAGAYIIRLTVDGELKEQFPLTVKESIVQTARDTSLAINGPTQGMVNEEVRLGAQGNARIFEWSFGETGRVDSKGATAFYTYRNPGTYFVKLQADNSNVAVFHKIVISATETYDAIIAPGEGERKVIDDIRAHLQSIAKGADFNHHYYYLVRKYFCGDEKVSVSLTSDGSSKQTDFYSYCMSLTFGGGIVIDEAGITLKPKSKCSGMLTVKQHTTSSSTMKK